MNLGLEEWERPEGSALMLYYARRAGYLEGAMMLIAEGKTGVDPQVAARRALDAVGPDAVEKKSQEERRAREQALNEKGLGSEPD